MTKKKLVDRMNILKILSYDKNWALKPILVRIYKSLVRSVLDYASVTAIACNVDVRKDFEVLQNDALRIIFKKNVMDHVKVDKLRKWANVDSIHNRHKDLLNRYYEQAIISNNPLIKLLFENYHQFKNTNFINSNLAIKADNSVDTVSLEFIRKHNKEQLLKKETHPTTLCGADLLIKQFVFDDFAVGGSGLS